MRTYESLLLVEPTVAAREWNKVTEEVERVVKRHGGTMVSLAKWGERKLAFPVRRAKRGAYVLAYFASPEKSVPKIRGDFALSEIIMRHIVVRHEGEMRKEPPKDFELAGTVPIRRGGDFMTGLDERPREGGGGRP